MASPKKATSMISVAREYSHQRPLVPEQHRMISQKIHLPSLPSRPFKMADYKFIDIIGSGAQGVIYRARDLVTGETVIIKQIKKLISPSKNNNEWSIINEVESLSAVETICQHHAWENPGFPSANVLCWSRFGESQTNFYIVTEYLGDYLTFREMMENEQPCTDSTVKQMIQQLITGLQMIHQVNVAHRDIKPENVMVKLHPLNIKYIDFGLSCHDDKCQDKKNVGSAIYMAPELMNTQTLPTHLEQWFKADIWSLGCMILELIAGSQDGKYDRSFVDIINGTDFQDLDSLFAFIRGLEETKMQTVYLTRYLDYCRQYRVDVQLIQYAKHVVFPTMVTINPDDRKL
uniref:Protein kinase domain-containing protein n=1 Tax=viral metagenome TaxID=1070528 RepID=A0A6C0BK81_9ZZZZ